MLFKINRHGAVINEASKSKIQRKYLFPINEFVTNFKLYFDKRLQSIIIRGSVSVGRAKPSISDIDCIIVIKKKMTTDLVWANKQARKLAKKYPFITLFDFTLTTKKELLTSKKYQCLRIYIQTQSICIFGENITKKLPPTKPGKTLARLMYANLETELFTLIDLFGNTRVRRTYQNKVMPTNFWCVWTMRTLLRSGLGLVMCSKKIYTQDLKDCYYEFSKKFPQFKSQMAQALRWAIQPTNNKKLLYNYLNNFAPQYLALWKQERDN